MSGSPSSEDQLAKAAQISGSESDPLAEYEDDFEGSGVDFFQLFVDHSLSKQNLKDSTVTAYRCAFKHWKEHMEREGRHPAFPNDSHVISFVEHERTKKGNGPATTKNKLRKLEAAYDYWVEESRLPHPKSYQPIDLARMKVNLKESPGKDVRILPVEKLRGVVSSIRSLRERALVVLQLKLGLRATEVSNIQIRDISIQNGELQSHFSQLGTHRHLRGYKDVIYIPSKRHREGNKSERPRLLPLDDEVRHLIRQYLLVRPSVEEPWLFLTKGSYKQLWRNEVNDAWDIFQSEYPESEDYRKITSHYGRHRFVTYWKVEQATQRELVQYMRGDAPGGDTLENSAAIDDYIHINYSDIEDEYREKIFKLNI